MQVSWRPPFTFRGSFVTDGEAVNDTEWRNIKNEVKRKTWNLKKHHYSRRVEQNKNKPNKLWKIIKDIAPSNFGQKKQDVELTRDMLNNFNKHFVNTGSRIQQQIEEEIQVNRQHKIQLNTNSSQERSRSETNLEKINYATEEQIRKIIKNIDGNKATGIDEIPIKVIKAAVDILAKPITGLINKIIDTCKIPDEFKTALVTPTFKTGDRTKADNYRPLSVLPVMSKILEYVIKDQIYDHLESNDIITDTQHAFRNGHSTTTCLLKLTEDVRRGLDEGKATGILAIDFSKAFDVIDHTNFIDEAARSGINWKNA